MTEKIVYLHTATSDIWDFKLRSQDARYAQLQPHLVGISAACDGIGIVRLVSPPEGVFITPEAVAIHGVTNEMTAVEPPFGEAIREGTPSIAELIDQATCIVAHSAAFHRKVLELSYTRAGLRMRDNVRWFCTMTQSADVVMVQLQSNGRWKWPSLQEALDFAAPGHPPVGPMAGDAHRTSPVVAVKLVHDMLVAKGRA